LVGFVFVFGLVEAVEGASGRARVAAGAAAPRVFQLVTD